MSHRRAARRLASGVVALGVLLAGCGGDEPELLTIGFASSTTTTAATAPTTSTTTTSTTEAPESTTTEPPASTTTDSTTTTTEAPAGVDAQLAAAVAEAAEGIGEVTAQSCTETEPNVHQCTITLADGEELRIEVVIQPDGSYTWDFI